MVIYLIGALIAFITSILAFKIENDKVNLGMFLGSIVIGLMSWFGFTIVVLSGAAILHFKAQEKGWYDIDLF